MVQLPHNLHARAAAGMVSALLVGATFAVTGCAKDNAQEPSAAVEPATSSTTESTAVPSVIGMTEDAATDKLESLGLNVSVKRKEVADSGQVGVVTSQKPAEGASLSAGNAVTITIGKKKPSSSSSSAHKRASASSISFPSTASAASISNKMDAKDTEYDTSNLPQKYRTIYDRGASAITSDDYGALAANVAALYDAYPNAAQSLVNSAKSEKWYSKFKKQLLERDADAEDLLDLD